MKALILAAGCGRRIDSLTQGRPKAFLELAGKRLLDHQIAAFRAVGVEQFALVVGHRSELFESDYSGVGFTLIKNPFFARTNVLGSVWLARAHLRGGGFFVHADTYFDPSILEDLSRQGNTGEILLATEHKETQDEEMKVQVKSLRVERISKEIPPEAAYGEFIGLAHIGAGIAPRLTEHVERLIEVEGQLDAFFEASIQACIDDGEHVRILDIGDRLAVEIDFPEDYHRAVRLLEERKA